MTVTRTAADAQVEVASHLRLTQRGRMVFGALAVTLMSFAMLFGASIAGPQAAASGESADASAFTYVVAAPGDSLWSIASRVAPNADTRDVIYEIQRLNQLDSSDLAVGQELAIPLQYND